MDSNTEKPLLISLIEGVRSGAGVTLHTDPSLTASPNLRFAIEAVLRAQSSTVSAGT